MINLLPPELKERYTYGRRNVTLRRWAFAVAFGVAGVIVVTFGGLFWMQNSITSYKSQVASSEKTLQQEKLDETSKHAADISANIKLAVDVLSHEVLFSQLLTQIAKVTPPNTTLTDLVISQTQGAIEIKANSADYTSATQLQVNLQDPANKIFSKADIQSITCGTGTDPKYPCQITLRALFNKDNPFLFINKAGAKP